MLLTEAIDKLDLPMLQSVFKEMCDASEEFRQEAAARLLITVPPMKRPASDSGLQDDAGPNKRPKLEDDSTAHFRHEPCQNCNQVFDVTKNTKTSCRYHDGKYMPRAGQSRERPAMAACSPGLIPCTPC